jgi:hypothetical protein
MAPRILKGTDKSIELIKDCCTSLCLHLIDGVLDVSTASDDKSDKYSITVESSVNPPS